MALSGSIINNFATGYRIQMNWSATQDVANNKSTVTASFYLISLGSSYTISSTAAKALSITIDGQTFNHTVYVGLTGNQTKLLATSSKDVYHNPDGSRTFGLSGSLGINVTLSGTYYGTINIPYTGFTLDTIPKATTPSLNYSTREMGQSIDISVTPASSGFSHKLYYSFTGISNTLIATLPAGNQTQAWTIPTATLAPKIPNATSGIVTITAETYSGATLIGTAQATFTATVPDYQPTASLTLTGVDLYSTRYVQGKSKVTAEVTAAGLYDSTITSISTKMNGSTYTGTPNTSELLTTSGTNAIETTVTDSRGKQKVVTQNITVVAYSAPKATTLTAWRSTSGGVADPSGAYIKASFATEISPIDDTNTKTTRIKFKKKSDSEWTTAYTNTSSYALNTSTVFAADVNYSYDILLEVVDYYSTATKDASVGTAFTLLDLHSGGQSMAIGKVAEGNGLLEMGGEILSTGTFNRGTWGTPTKGALTQIIDETQSQHSVIVGRNGSGERVYGLDLYDRTADPTVRLYAGTNHVELSSLGFKVNGNSLQKEVLTETCFLPVDFNLFRCTTNTAGGTNVTIPLTKVKGNLTLASNLITLTKGFLYELEVSFALNTSGAAQITVANTSNASQLDRIQHAWTSDYYSAPGFSNQPGYGLIDLTAAGSDLQVKALVLAVGGAPNVDINFGYLAIRKMKKITI